MPRRDREPCFLCGQRHESGMAGSSSCGTLSFMARVPWSSLSPATYEDMVAVLLSRLYPASQRIDGKGGDGGRDVQFETPAGARTYELKSFTGRMTPGRRTQVVASLSRASTLNPAAWTLVVPIDPNPAELRWFETLRKRVPFGLSWRGLTWLDDQMAAFPDIPRYFLHDAADEVISLARLLDQESSVLAGGAPEAIERAARLVTQLNELDPFYRFEITSDGVASSIKVIPRYAGAEKDRPIIASFTMKFPDDPAGRAARDEFQRAMDFGTHAKVPAEYVHEARLDAPAGLGEALQIASVEVGPARVPPEARTFIFACIDAAGSTLAELPVDLHIVSRGRRGAILEGRDRTDVLSATVTVDATERKFNVSFSVESAPFYPHEMVSLARFLSSFAGPNCVEIRASDGSRLGLPAPASEEPLAHPGFAELVADLALIQWASRVNRKVGPEFTLDDARAIALGAMLLRGERVEVSWAGVEVELSPATPADYRQQMLAGEFPFWLETHEPVEVKAAGVSYVLGRGYRLHCLSAVLDLVPDEWARTGIIPDGAHLKFRPGSSNVAYLTLSS